MANRLLHPSPTPNFIKSVFLDACHIKDFHDHSMAADTWAELICQCFNLDTAMVFTGKDLVKMLSLHKSKYLRNMMDVDCCNVHHDHIGIFHDKVKLKGSGTQHCFFTCKSGKAPQITSTKWYKLISDGKDLKLGTN